MERLPTGLQENPKPRLVNFNSGAQTDLGDLFQPPTLEEVKRELFIKHLRFTKGNMSEATRNMGVSVKTAYNWIHLWNINPDDYRE